MHAALEAATGRGAYADATPVAGGCINRCFAVRQGGERYFVKLNDARYADAFAAEADGLAALAEGGMRVPAALGHGQTDGEAFLVLEYLPLARGTDAGFRRLAEALAGLHGAARDAFGWPRDNYIGATPQRNSPGGDWARFWTTCRLGPQLERAAQAGHRLDADQVLSAAEKLLAAHRPAPALVHGDLWSGNVGFLEDGTPVVFDPAVYAGDAETDLAMTALFGGFPAAFAAAYRACRPPTPGQALRRDLYNLYHLLNHLNLFGSGYLGQAQQLIARLAAAAG